MSSCASTRRDSHFHRFKRRAEWEDDDFSDDEGGGGRPYFAGASAHYGDEDYREDDDEDRSDVEEDDGGEWGAPTGKRGGKKNGRRVKSSNARSRGRGRVISRHITASRRKAAAASGDTGIMGLGALSVQRVARHGAYDKARPSSSGAFARYHARESSLSRDGARQSAGFRGTVDQRGSIVPGQMRVHLGGSRNRQDGDGAGGCAHAQEKIQGRVPPSLQPRRTERPAASDARARVLRHRGRASRRTAESASRV